jgi:proteasome accessory factor B
MAAITQERIERLKRIEELLSDDGLTIAELEHKLSDNSDYKLPHRRTLQRDLQEIIEEGRVEVLAADEGGPLYRRIQEPFALNSAVLAYVLKRLQDDLKGLVSATDLAEWLRKLQPQSAESPDYVFDKSKLRILPDSLRLQAAEIRHQPFAGVLQALATGCALRVVYFDRLNQRSEPVLHPLAMLQRGPRIYLYAIKNDETVDRMYALDRFISAECLPIAARTLPDFDLDQRIANGNADFSNGEAIQLKLVVRGYIRRLVEDCPLATGQLMESLDDDMDSALLSVTMPSSGQLLRWILAGGENITVLEPADFRDVVVGQIFNTSARYKNN